MDEEEKEKVEEAKVEPEYEYDDESKINRYVAHYGGATIGGVIALLLCITGIYKLLFCIIVILVGMFIGNYIQKNKIDVKQKLKDFIDKF